MTYKLGDRVVVTKVTWHINSLIGLKGVVTSKAGPDLIGIALDDRNAQYKSGRVYFTANELELDKNYTIKQIIKDL
jgi:hypothetical protein